MRCERREVTAFWKGNFRDYLKTKKRRIPVRGNDAGDMGL